MFLIDQSESMRDPYGGRGGQEKQHVVATALNRLLWEFVCKCVVGRWQSSSELGELRVKDRFHIGVIGYGASVGPVWGGMLAGRELVPISEVAPNPLRIE